MSGAFPHPSDVAQLLLRLDEVKAALKRLDPRFRPWEEWEKDALKELFPLMTNNELAVLFGRSPFAVKKMAHKKLKVGRKFPHVVDRARSCAASKAARTRVERDRLPSRWLPVGTIVSDSYGYLKIKVSGRRDRSSYDNWRHLHILEWEKHHGPVPNGFNVVFRNGNHEDVRIDNLELISNEELMRRNTLHRYPKEIVAVIQLKGRVTRKINERAQPHEEPN